MDKDNFFEEQKEQSLVKTAIVQKYFDAWAKVMIKSAKAERIAYIDLFAGPGRYKDETKSTPLLILEKAVQDPDLRTRLVSKFNDKNSDNSRSLQTAIAEIPGLETLKYQPQVFNDEVGETIVKTFEQMKLIPTLFFVDPWGYKGLSLRLVNSVVKDFGCECVFFFNYNRINMGLSNPAVIEHMEALFGIERVPELKEKLEPLSPQERELEILEKLTKALLEMQAKYVLPFGFKNDRGNRTSHYLIFVTKHIRGYEIMKDIMDRGSSGHIDGVPSFEYAPATENQQLLFQFARPIEDLKTMILKEFSGRTLSMEQIYNAHHAGKRFVKRNYKQALQDLEEAGRLTADPPAEKRPTKKGKITFGDRVNVTIP